MKETLSILLLALLSMAINMGLFMVLVFGGDEVALVYRNTPLWGVEGLAEFLWGFVGVLVLVPVGVFSTVYLLSIHDGCAEETPFIFDRPMRVNAGDVDPADTVGTHFSRADDQFLIVTDNSRDKFMDWFSGLMLLFVFCGLLTGPIKGEFDMTLGMGFACLFFACPLYIRSIVFPVRKIVFDRMKGTVMMPRLWGILPRHAIRLSDVKMRGSYNLKEGFFMAMTFPYANFFRIPIHVWFPYEDKTWYMFIQYMDKNYPLPGGTAFDPYRERDFKRRQAEGFPKPIYNSIPWLTDESCGYVQATDAVKAQLAKFKRVDIIKACGYVEQAVFSRSDQMDLTTTLNDMALVGIYENNYVFKAVPDFHGEIIEFKDYMLRDCFLVSGMARNKVQYIPERGITNP